MSKVTGGNRRKWKLDQEALSLLIRALGSPERYEELHRRLTSLFRWERCPFPDECADEAMDRLAKRLQSGEQIGSHEAYVRGVSRFIIQESRRASREAPFLVSSGPSSDEQRLACLDSCLNGLEVSQRTLILRYYQGETADRIDARRKLAAELGLDINALRNRALRLRDRLETCVRNCLEARSGVMKS